ncbi:hypothetical protein PCANC_27031 [Puccinia coronata f. sp. avenae]|uniref:Uncharacterized protein n=1 Tax=Puccinia coronata f. sp. avenae TaxID=200324 RepID=A0A2N5TN12_9BASI|nr:hypothetical protein PCANC_27031 [Puccinia coronata f. sp. avenae]
MDKTTEQQTNMKEAEAAATLLEKKKQATISMLEQKRRQNAPQTGGTGGSAGNQGDANQEQVPIGDILEGMGDVQVSGERQQKDLGSGVTPTSEPQAPKDLHVKDTEERQERTFLVRSARKALMAGDALKSDAIMQSLADLYPPKSEVEGVKAINPMGEETPPETSTAIIEVDDSSKEGKKPKGAVEGGRKFIDGVVPSHGYCGIPTFYNKNLRQLKDLVPLTIFNLIWKQQAAAYALEKKAVDRGSSEERRYTGHPAPSEWSQSYAQWARNYQCFIKTLREVYDYGKLADWALIHRDRVDGIMLKNGLCAGLRYDLAVRSNAFQCNTIHKGEDCFPDISLKRGNSRQKPSTRPSPETRHSIKTAPPSKGGREKILTHTREEQNPIPIGKVATKASAATKVETKAINTNLTCPPHREEGTRAATTTTARTRKAETTATGQKNMKRRQRNAPKEENKAKANRAPKMSHSAVGLLVGQMFIFGKDPAGGNKLCY